MKPLDRRKLLDWLKGPANHRNALVAACYLALATRIAQGQFDTEEDR